MVKRYFMALGIGMMAALVILAAGAAIAQAEGGQTYLPTVVSPPPDDDYPPIYWRVIRPDQLPPGRPTDCDDTRPGQIDSCGVICFYIDEGLPDFNTEAAAPGPDEGPDQQFEIACMAYEFDLNQ